MPAPLVPAGSHGSDGHVCQHCQAPGARRARHCCLFTVGSSARSRVCLSDASWHLGDGPSSTDALCAGPDICRLGALRLRPLGESIIDVGAGMHRLTVSTDLVRLSGAVAAFDRKE